MGSQEAPSINEHAPRSNDLPAAVCDYVSWERSGGLTYAYGAETKKRVVRGRTTYEEHAPRPSS